jgi:hypothetical protein
MWRTSKPSSNTLVATSNTMVRLVRLGSRSDDNIKTDLTQITTEDVNYV